ncbi:Tim44/TimA family putative adaptor protein [Candidatus Endolissoclinum faulkneri]|uniref:Tim44/TimA family putative adaptor protein n=1 Tax=Candidatus Endolissoclinum faulkneri TaxID=1263979 RepID=UPI0011834692|nr:Tim44/TimA family putative adaptor protein [Candidatus Endolissoclinum faulkneri]
MSHPKDIIYMGSSFPLFEVIIYAMIAGFLILKLRNVLGRRTDNEKKRTDHFSPSTQETDNGNIISLSDRVVRESPENNEITSSTDRLACIKQADSKFDERKFLTGARVAFEMIVKAYETGDVDMLKSLLSIPLYSSFMHAIEDREQAKEIQKTSIITFRSIDITGAELIGYEALITLKFVTEHVRVNINDSNKELANDPDSVDTLIDIWTFKRDVRSSDPNWELVLVCVPEEE